MSENLTSEIFGVINGGQHNGGVYYRTFLFSFFFSQFHLFSTKTLSKVLRFFLFRTFSGKNWSKIRSRSVQMSLPKVRQQTLPIVLLVEIDENAIFKLIFFVFFLHIIVEIGETYALKHFCNQLKAKLTVINRKSEKMRQQTPHCAIPQQSKMQKKIVSKKSSSCHPIFIKIGMDSLQDINKSMQKKKIILDHLRPEQSEALFQDPA